MKIKCPKCKREFEPPIIRTGETMDNGDTELLAECPNSACDARFYTFAKLEFEAFED